MNDQLGETAHIRNISDSYNVSHLVKRTTDVSTNSRRGCIVCQYLVSLINELLQIFNIFVTTRPAVEVQSQNNV